MFGRLMPGKMVAMPPAQKLTGTPSQDIITDGSGPDRGLKVILRLGDPSGVTYLP